MSLFLDKVRKRFPEFLLDVSLSAERGTLLALLGPSGCGKTTTLNIIAGFIEPESGSIALDGRSIVGLAPHMRGIGLVFQDYALFPNMDVRGNIAFGLEARGRGRAEVARRVGELLRLAQLDGYERRKVTELSGGEQQRVALARALAPEPGLLLLDEPLSALDARLRKELRVEIRRIQRELGVTTVYVTHDQEEALAIADRVVVMRGGKVEQAGTPFEIYHRPVNGFVAGFVGISNRVSGRVTGRRGGALTIEGPEGIFRARLRGASEASAVLAGTVGPALAGTEGPALAGTTGPVLTGTAGPVLTGTEVILVFRPEKCAVARAGRPPASRGANVIEGKVASCEYLGDSTLIEVRSGGGSYGVKVPGFAACGIGERVNVSFLPADCWVLREDGDA
jgi:ABC-type Fe3+/spermidine/putrescine transport system ATPase subunit